MRGDFFSRNIKYIFSQFELVPLHTFVYRRENHDNAIREPSDFHGHTTWHPRLAVGMGGRAGVGPATTVHRPGVPWSPLPLFRRWWTSVVSILSPVIATWSSLNITVRMYYMHNRCGLHLLWGWHSASCLTLSNSLHISSGAHTLSSHTHHLVNSKPIWCW